MKKISNFLLSAVMVLTCFAIGISGLQAQNKPKTESVPAATVNLASLLPTVTYSGTDKVNYVRTFDLYQPLSVFPTGTTLTNAINAGNIMQATQYMDGLGRPIQTVSRKGSGSGTDLVSFVVYDEYGRPSLAPMPYKASTTTGVIQLTPSADQSTFLNNHYTGEDIFYGKTEFESSPLNRPVKQMAPGNSWTGRGKGVTSAYLTNTAADGVRIWTLGTTPATTAVYQDGELSIMAITDENGNQVKEYTNRNGQVVLKKVQKDGTGNGHSDWLNTYYVYDDLGNLRYVLPPRAVELISNNWGWYAIETDDLVYEYDYDGLNRMISKKVPGSGRVDMVYDKLDRLVASQDANQNALNQWTFTKYDELNRPVLTGFLTSTSNRATLQADLDSWTGELFVKREGLSTTNVLEGATITTSVRDTDIDTYRTKETGYVDYLPGFVSVTDDEFLTERTLALSFEYTFYEGYHDATFPLLSTATAYKMNTVNFYDDYEFTTKAWSTDFTGFFTGGTENAVTPAQYANVKGLATGSKVRILGADDWLTTIMFYDDRGRVVQTQGENHLGGTDISTTQYDFAGRVLHTYTVHNNPLASSNSTTRILKEFGYDHAGRLLTVKEKLNNTGSLKTLVTNSYNDLGELESKVLGDDLESLDYEYNIRGWLKSINGDYVADGTGGNFFGMDLSYDYGFDQNQLNGNIAGIKWRSQSSDKQRAYGFDYDRVNRLTVADYHQNDGTLNAWSQATANFSTGYDYDPNGNILKLMRKGVVAGTVTTLDSLSYSYGSGYTKAGFGNQLMKVKDAQGDLGQGDFKDGNTTGDDYDYDLNGNMKDDLNKGITNITYNHLNLPLVVSFGSSKSITYTYDAAGIKLSKLVNDNGSLTTTDYAGGFIYENNALQHFAHEEGRVRLESGEAKYDYFIKDHLGNTRMTLTEARDSTVYDATMETSLATFEESVFLNVAATRSSEEAFEGTQSAKLGPESIGPAKMLVVSPGDTVDLSVYAKYPSGFTSTSSGSDTNIGLALASLFGATGGAATVYEQGVYNNLNNNAGTFLASAINTGSSTVPKAYLNYVFFDQDFNLVMSKSGYQQVDAGASGAFDLITANGLIMEQAGYLYVYVSNEGRTTDGGNVYFDALRVNHKKGAIIQEDHYYPFGLTINALSSSTPLSTPNRFLYNEGSEKTFDFNINVYETHYRILDPQLGRWWQIDPEADQLSHQSPYLSMDNDPISLSDFLGNCTTCAQGEEADKLYAIGAIVSNKNGIWEYLGGGKWNTWILFGKDGGNRKPDEIIGNRVMGNRDGWGEFSDFLFGDREWQDPYRINTSRLAPIYKVNHQGYVTGIKPQGSYPSSFDWVSPGGAPQRVKSLVDAVPQFSKLVKKLVKNPNWKMEIKHLYKQLLAGNYNSGKGAQRVFGNVQEMRGRNGARIYFTKSGDNITILAYSNKQTQDQVINRLRTLYE